MPRRSDIDRAQLGGTSSKYRRSIFYIQGQLKVFFKLKNVVQGDLENMTALFQDRDGADVRFRGRGSGPLRDREGGDRGVQQYRRRAAPPRHPAEGGQVRRAVLLK